ncbi:hypothetical protein [Streptomyces sp. NPDC048111]|uniref:hypothetical protein n=1 Tax=Streptomyces sp. NPDC048111 TaxID=3365500 RepID=UPI0037195D13
MHLRRTVLAVAAGVMAPVALLAGPAEAVDGTSVGLAMPDRSPADSSEEREADGDGRQGHAADEDQGVTVSLRGLPDEFIAGGPWREVTVVVDAEPSDAARDVTFMIVDGDGELSSDHVDVQVREASGWRDVAPTMPSSTAHYELVVSGGTLQVSIRVRFHDDAPLKAIDVGASDGISLASPWYGSRIVRPADPGGSGGGDPTDPGGEGTGGPGGEEPADPGGEAGTGSPGGSTGGGAGEPTGGGAGGPAPGDHQPGPVGDPAVGEQGAAAGSVGQASDVPSGELAETGLGTATRWQLGLGATAIALGAGVCRYRRRTG